ncbi:DUF397 domain-containing protein [Streptomyces sp. GC420]|uniref:DUF397 domain-containing protein n=1 Tax=Streptomyces sp. GC420 TaxID=2697568 RepID=UPI001414D8DD|nr:DUF397 domain-containing protein [Streptomyces sp. GC420]NBM17339.1 DUF397 domain-containing protein [Streptomyces sp. GC420]
MPAHEWLKSSFCQTGEACIHVTRTDEGSILLTESSDPHRAVLSASPASFGEFLRALKAGQEAGQRAGTPRIEVAAGPGDTVRVRGRGGRPEGGEVTTTRPQWAAFVRGVRAGEFDRLLDEPAPS